MHFLNTNYESKNMSVFSKKLCNLYFVPKLNIELQIKFTDFIQLLKYILKWNVTFQNPFLFFLI